MDLQFAEDVRLGLSSTPKYLPSKYFYNEAGDKLFQAIMHMPEYYLTRCEFEIFQHQKSNILRRFQEGLSVDESFQLIEFGAGDGLKTEVLLQYFVEMNANFVYSPVDISGHVLTMLTQRLTASLPMLSMVPIEDDYFKALARVKNSEEFQQTERRIVMFLGSNLGNFAIENALRFLNAISEQLVAGDLLLIGLDLKKNPQTILDAYNDTSGITRDFNLNLLQRINDELGGNFVIEQFLHYPTYDPLTGRTKSFLVSQKNQDVQIEALQAMFSFKAWEAIDMELSYKYSLEEVDEIARQSGFTVLENFFDTKKYFTDSIWQKQ